MADTHDSKSCEVAPRVGSTPTSGTSYQYFPHTTYYKPPKKFLHENRLFLRHNDFMFQITKEGVAILSSVLNSERAIMVNIRIMRAFIQLKRMLLTNADLRAVTDKAESDNRVSCPWRFLKKIKFWSNGGIIKVNLRRQ